MSKAQPSPSEATDPSKGSFSFPATFSALKVTTLDDLPSETPSRNNNTSSSKNNDSSQGNLIRDTVNVTVGRTDGKHALVEFSINERKNAHQITVTASTSEDNDTLNVDIQFVSTDSPSSSKKLSFFENMKTFMGGNKGKLKAQIQILLPVDIAEFNMTGHLGNLTWDGPNVTSKFIVKLDVGTVAIKSPIRCNEANIKTNVGSLKLEDLRVSDSVRVKADVGEIQANLAGYKDANVESGVGSMTVRLSPMCMDPTVAGLTELKSGVGAINASVYGFKGRYAVTSGLGFLKLSGVDKPSKNVGSSNNDGWVGGEKAGEARFSCTSGVGKTRIAFDEEVPMSEEDAVLADPPAYPDTEAKM
ncbi:hypothetical protein BJ741DRAFT_586634 [Chytriomyces cf. hyalinus JEL632]|nr:hypothetical protein BJ741DRAFT_586634 [Chytriomyces cf. hyalinus JEL632]